MVQLMFDENTIINSMREKGINLDEMPLGALTSERVMKASSILKEISALLGARPSEDSANATWKKRIQAKSTQFFHQIPSRTAVIIETNDVLEAQAAVVNMLTDICVVQKIKKSKGQGKNGSGGKENNTQKIALKPHLLDEQYSSLGLVCFDPATSANLCFLQYLTFTLYCIL